MPPTAAPVRRTAVASARSKACSDGRAAGRSPWRDIARSRWACAGVPAGEAGAGGLAADARRPADLRPAGPRLPVRKHRQTHQLVGERGNAGHRHARRGLLRRPAVTDGHAGQFALDLGQEHRADGDQGAAGRPRPRSHTAGPTRPPAGARRGGTGDRHRRNPGRTAPHQAQRASPMTRTLRPHNGDGAPAAYDPPSRPPVTRHGGRTHRHARLMFPHHMCARPACFCGCADTYLAPTTRGSGAHDSPRIVAATSPTRDHHRVSVAARASVRSSEGVSERLGWALSAAPERGRRWRSAPRGRGRGCRADGCARVAHRPACTDPPGLAPVRSHSRPRPAGAQPAEESLGLGSAARIGRGPAYLFDRAPTLRTPRELLGVVGKLLP